MREISLLTVNNLYVVYINSNVRYFVDDKINQHDFAMDVFNLLKTENTKSLSIYPYGNPEAEAILEYNKYDDGDIEFWVVPKDDLFDGAFDGAFEFFENAPCDNSGFCIGTSCPHYFKTCN